MQLETLISRYPSLEGCKGKIKEAYLLLANCFSNRNTLFVCGNGGSCADAEHIVGELMKGFKAERKCPIDFQEALKRADPQRGEILSASLQQGLRTIALHENPALFTAYLNDVKEGGTLFYAQQLYGYGKEGDVLLGISTSGNAENVLNAAVVARALKMKIIALTGKDGGALGRFADVSIQVPETETYRVQELHLPVYHCLCLMLEETFFSGDRS